MRVVWLVALRDLRGRVRDRSAWITAVAAPVLLAAILSLAFSAGEGIDVHLVLASDTADDPAVAATLRGLAGIADRGDLASARQVKSITELRALVADDDDVDAGIIVQAPVQGSGPESGQGSGQGPRQGVRQGVRLTVVRNEASPVSGDIALAIAQGVALQAASPPGGPLYIEERLSGRSPTNADYYGPAMAIFFVFFVMAFGPLSLIAERREGTLARLAASPIRMASVIAGKGLAVFVLGIASISAVWLVTTLLFDAHWGSPLAVIALVVATVFAAGGITTMVAGRARTERQADGQISIVVFIGALLGGSFLPLDALPASVRMLSAFTPNGWAMRGFIKLNNGGGIGDITLNVAVLLAMGAVSAVVAGLRANRTLAVTS